MTNKEKKNDIEGVSAGLGVDISGTMDASAAPKNANNSINLSTEIKAAAKGLYYISETDAEISPFTGSKTDAVTKENLLAVINKAADTPVEERDFEKFFESLTALQDWFGDEEKANAAKFSVLHDLLKNNLSDLKVFKVGKIELDIYVVGLDANSILTGAQTKAVET